MKDFLGREVEVDQRLGTKSSGPNMFLMRSRRDPKLLTSVAQGTAVSKGTFTFGNTDYIDRLRSEILKKNLSTPSVDSTETPIMVTNVLLPGMRECSNTECGVVKAQDVTSLIFNTYVSNTNNSGDFVRLDFTSDNLQISFATTSPNLAHHNLDDSGGIPSGFCKTKSWIVANLDPTEFRTQQKTTDPSHWWSNYHLMLHNDTAMPPAMNFPIKHLDAIFTTTGATDECNLGAAHALYTSQSRRINNGANMETIMERHINEQLFQFVCEIFASTEALHNKWSMDSERDLVNIYSRKIEVESGFLRLHLTCTVRVAFVADHLRAGLYPIIQKIDWDSDDDFCSTGSVNPVKDQGLQEQPDCLIGIDSPYVYEPLTDMTIEVTFEELPDRTRISADDVVILADDGNLIVYPDNKDVLETQVSPVLKMTPASKTMSNTRWYPEQRWKQVDIPPSPTALERIDLYYYTKKDGTRYGVRTTGNGGYNTMESEVVPDFNSFKSRSLSFLVYKNIKPLYRGFMGYKTTAVVDSWAKCFSKFVPDSTVSLEDSSTTPTEIAITPSTWDNKILDHNTYYVLYTGISSNSADNYQKKQQEKKVKNLPTSLLTATVPTPRSSALPVYRVLCSNNCRFWLILDIGTRFQDAVYETTPSSVSWELFQNYYHFPNKCNGGGCKTLCSDYASFCQTHLCHFSYDENQFANYPTKITKLSDGYSIGGRVLDPLYASQSIGENIFASQDLTTFVLDPYKVAALLVISAEPQYKTNISVLASNKYTDNVFTLAFSDEQAITVLKNLGNAKEVVFMPESLNMINNRKVNLATTSQEMFMKANSIATQCATYDPNQQITIDICTVLSDIESVGFGSSVSIVQNCGKNGGSRSPAINYTLIIIIVVAGVVASCILGILVYWAL